MDKITVETVTAINSAPYPELYNVTAEPIEGGDIAVKVVHDCNARAIGLDKEAVGDFIEETPAGAILKRAGYVFAWADEVASEARYTREAAK